MSLSTQPYKGARDFYPEDLRLQKYIFSKIRQVVERFGYEEYDAPALEPLELYLAKTGDEVVNEQTYAFTDRGDRQVALRPEMTPTVSRMVAAKRQELAYPARLYNIGSRWRYERPQKGRWRQFVQTDIDIFGADGIEAEYEVIALSNEIMRALGAKPSMYTIKLNSREFMNYVMSDYLGMDDVQRATVARLIDRIHKLSQDEFVTQLDALCTPSQRESGAVEKLLAVLQAESIDALPDNLGAHQSLAGLKQVLAMLESATITNAVFDVTVMRGLDYYTDIVFEVFDNDPENNRSMYGGGRYAGLVGLFGVEPLQAVGFAMGDAVLTEFLKGHDLVPELPTETRVYAVLVGDVFARAQPVLRQLREDGVNVAVDMSGRDIGKQIKTADKKGIPYVLIIGQQELDSEQFTLKNLQSGKEEKHSIARIATIVQDSRDLDL